MSPPTWTHTAYTQRLHFGAGAVRRLPEVLKEVGARRVLLVTTAGRLASDDGQRVVAALGRSLASTFDGVRSHLPTDVVQAALLQARRDGVDGVVSFGGGSAMDLGKAIVYFTEQEAGTPGTSYVDRPALPHVAIPTTYSGAEVTMAFGMTDEHTRTKGGGGGPTSAPIAVVYDPELTLSTPVRVTRRDRHERPRPLRRGRLRHPALTRGRGHRPRRCVAAAGRPPAGASTTRPTSPPAPTCWPPPRWPAGRSRTPAWACTTGCRSCSAGGPASPTAWPTPSCCPTPSASTPRSCPRRWSPSATRSATRTTRRRPSSGSATGSPSSPAFATSASPRRTSTPSPASARAAAPCSATRAR